MSGPSPEPPNSRHRPRLSSLRARLIASHVSVILLALLIVLVVSSAWLRRDERRAQIDALTNLAVPLLVESRAVTTNRFSARPVREEIVADLFAAQADEMDLRILVIDASGLVLLDTATATVPGSGGNLTGRILTSYATSVARIIQSSTERDAFVSRVETPRQREPADPFAGQIVLLAASGQSFVTGGTPRALVLVEPPRQQGVVARFVPPLLLALACALCVAVVAGYGFSRRLAAPVSRLTRAADSMAAGDLEHHIPVDGSDEIGRLVGSFNTMSSRVAAIDRAQRALLADVSHELRTPLTNVQGYTQALRDGLLRTPAEIDTALSTIATESSRMACLIYRLLDLARLESGQSRLAFAPTPIHPLFTATQKRFSAQATARDIDLRIDAPNSITFFADADRISQILDNLIANAIRHTPNGGQISISAHARNARAGRPAATVITVRDTGSGIPPDRIPTIFDRFTRAPTGSQEGLSFGLGLAIVKELTELHGGTVTIQSAPGSGTTVTLEFPSTTGDGIPPT